MKVKGKNWTYDQTLRFCQQKVARDEAHATPGIAKAIEKHIRKSDKAPAGFSKRIRRVAKDTTTDLKVRGRKFKIPWLLLLILIPVLIVIFLIITRKKSEDEGGYAPGASPDEPIDLKDRDTQGLLSDFDYKKRG